MNEFAYWHTFGSFNIMNSNSVLLGCVHKRSVYPLAIIEGASVFEKVTWLKRSYVQYYCNCIL